MEEYINNLKNRYATKRFDKSKKLTKEQEQLLLDTLILAPSSYGLQPYKFVLVENSTLREKIKEASYNQSQVTDASMFVVLCTRTDIDENMVDNYIKKMSEIREVPENNLEEFKRGMMASINAMTQEKLHSWAEKQVYIALGFLLDAAAQNGIDACPMEGFNKTAVNEILSLKDLKLEASVCCAIGFRASNDEAANRAKVRLGEQELVIVL